MRPARAIAPFFTALSALSALAAQAVLPACKRPSPAPAAVDAGPAVVASKDTSAAKKPPALRVAHPGTPALPDLPALASHEPVAALPPGTDLSGHPCRSVWTGSGVMSLACAKSILFDRTGGGAAVVVPRDLLHRDPDALPAVVDHRLDRSEGPVRNQGGAPACTAFATAAALDHALARWSGAAAAVSVMQIWARYHSPHEGVSLSANLGLPLGPEARWAFDEREAISWVACSEYDRPPKAGCGKPADDARARTVEALPLGEFTEVEYLEKPEVTVLQSKIAAGQDVLVALELPTTFAPRGSPGARYVPHWTKSGGPGAGHALLLAGYARLPHGTYFLAHNSWGAGWGDGGYAWLHEASLRSWLQEAVALDAEPAERDPNGRPLRGRGETTCEGDLVPDSIRGVCSPSCPDGSPRHDGVCAVAGQCPPAYVNLTGACVLAAPAATGRDPRTDVSWRCGPGGCSYELPRASDPTCTGNRCKASCPAPDFHVARLGKTLVCVE